MTHYLDSSNAERDVTNISPNAEPDVVEGIDQTIQDLHKPRYPSREELKPSCYTPGSASSARAITVMEELQDPSIVSEAMSHGDAAEWKSAIKAVLDSLIQHRTWDVVKQPEGAVPLTSRFVFVRKYDATSNLTRHNARRAVRGYL